MLTNTTTMLMPVAGTVPSTTLKLIKLISTARSTCPATMLANNRTVRAKHLATTPMTSNPAIIGAMSGGPWKKCLI